MINKRNKKRIVRSVICGYVVLLTGCKDGYYSWGFKVIDKAENSIAVENCKTLDQRVINMSETFDDSVVYNYIKVDDMLFIPNLPKETPMVVKHNQDCNIEFVNDTHIRAIVRAGQQQREKEQVRQYMQNKHNVH